VHRIAPDYAIPDKCEVLNETLENNGYKSDAIDRNAHSYRPLATAIIEALRRSEAT
jgi:hypothetical protein